MNQKPPSAFGLMLNGLFIILLIIVLAGCLPTDPYTLQSAGNQALAAAHAAMTATAESAIRRAEAAILQQAQTQSANDNAATSTAAVLYSDATATALWHDAQATQAAATAQAIATQEAQTAAATRQAVALAQLQAGATATQQAALSIASAENARLAREKVVTVAGWVGVFGALVLFLFLAFEFFRIFNHAYGKQKAWVDGAETFIMDTATGPVLVQPRKMFGPTLQLDGKTGMATMPQLAPPDLQAYTTLAALAVELQREISKRAQWFTPSGKGGRGTSGESFVPMLAQDTPLALLPMPALKPLPMFTDRHILIAGATGTGKTHTARYLLQARQTAYVIDPHDDGKTWPGHCQVIGGGRDFAAVAETIENMLTLMDNRYRQREMGVAHFDPVTLAVDEIPAIVAHQPETAQMLMQLGMEGRKAGLYLVLLSQSVLVRSLHIEGQGDLRENFATVRLTPLPPGTPQDTPRTATVTVGSLNKPESEEKYLVPALRNAVPALPDLVPDGQELVPRLVPNGVGTGSHALEPPAEPGSVAEAALIRELSERGYSWNKISNLLGGRRQDTLERVRAVLGEM